MSIEPHSAEFAKYVRKMLADNGLIPSKIARREGQTSAESDHLGRMDIDLRYLYNILNGRRALREHHLAMFIQCVSERRELSDDRKRKIIADLREGFARLGIFPMPGSSTFGQFWSDLLGDGDLLLIEAHHQQHRAMGVYPERNPDNDGILELEAGFRDAFPSRHRLLSFPWGAFERYESLLTTHSVLVSGGAVANGFCERFFNHLPGLRYYTNYDMPGFKHGRIDTRNGDLNYSPAVGSHEDQGLLTIMRNPDDSDRMIIGVMGVRGLGTRETYRLISEPRWINTLREHVTLPLEPEARGVQILTTIEHSQLSPTFLSVHRW